MGGTLRQSRSGLARMLVCVFILCVGFRANGGSAPDTVMLDRGWSFSRSGASVWLPATVPGTVHQDLLRHGLIPDPFYATNENEIQWVEDEDWDYKTVFTVTAGQLARDGAVMSFAGLDTYADVFLNGSLVLRADNMFVGYEVPVKEQLRVGDNRLVIRFRSPITETLPQRESNGFDYPADNDRSVRKLSVFTRKAPYSYGWDWGIRMVTSGIWRPVKLCFYDVARIEDCYVRQVSLSGREACLSGELEVRSVLAGEVEAEVTFTASFDGKECAEFRQPVVLRSGVNRVAVPMKISDPAIWMPNGWGDPSLYTFTAKVVCGGDTVASATRRVGLRTLRLVREEDSVGESFCFEVNGVPMFAKGANYIPGDAMLPAMTDERYAALFRDIKEAGMNMVRVWGGGAYEDDRFYDLADENGILVWQDFMFACTAYPSDPEFLASVAREADYNIKRLRGHPCLALWCGNNEIMEGMEYWGWKSRYSPDVYGSMADGYDRLFRNLLPSKVKELDSGREYVHSSPAFANWGRPDSWGTGDSHNWGIWYGEKPFESADAEIGRFQSEYGFESFPEMKTIASFAPAGEYSLESETMKARQKSTKGNDLIRKYMERDFIVPGKFDDFVYVGLVLQGQGVRHCIEAHRRNRPYCMGSLYWQLNDSWPAVSWSGIDYYGNWKALHYQARRAFAPLAINPVEEDDSLNVYMLSDMLTDLIAMRLEMRLMDFGGNLLAEEAVPVDVPVNSSVKVYGRSMDGWIDADRRDKVFMLLRLIDGNGKVLARTVHYFAPTKDLDLPEARISSRVLVADGRCEVTLSSDKLAKDVFVQIPLQGARFSDNFFDLLPGETRTITIESAGIRRDSKPEIKIKHIRDTY